jgi:hypothetical protein
MKCTSTAYPPRGARPPQSGCRDDVNGFPATDPFAPSPDDRPDSPGTPASAVARAERARLAELAIGAAVSGVVGAAGWLLGRRPGRATLSAFGRQTLGWATVDAVIAGWGIRGAQRSRTERDADRQTDREGRRARRMVRVTALNAGMDVGYLAVGVTLARRPQRRGDGAAVVLQALFLFWLDVRHSRRFARLAAC